MTVLNNLKLRLKKEKPINSLNDISILYIVVNCTFYSPLGLDYVATLNKRNCVDLASANIIISETGTKFY